MRRMLVLFGLALPAAAWADVPRAMGTVNFISIDATCATYGYDCWRVEVDCPALMPMQASLRIRYAESSVPKGIVIFASGGPGNKFWGGSRPAREAVATLASNGYTTVEIAWKGAWWNDPSATIDGSYQGYPSAACRPATVAQYVHDSFVGGDPSQAFCAAGTSGGAAQVAFMLTHYGLADSLDLLIPISGPPIARNDVGCFHTPGYESMWYESSTAKTVDQSFGVNANGPCLIQDIAYETLYRDASVSVGGQYYYPSTMVHFIFGGADVSSAIGQGNYHFETLVAAGTPAVGRETVADAGHQVQDTSTGAATIRDKLLAECLVR